MIKYKDSDGETFNIAGNYASLMPVGVVLPFMGATAPVNFLLCDGSEFDADTFPELYALLGSNKTPDLRNRTVFGKDATNAAGDTTDGALPNISGTFVLYSSGASSTAVPIWTTSGAFTTGGRHAKNGFPNGTADVTSVNNIMKLDASRSSSVYQTTDKVVPSSVYMNFIIKAK